MTERVVVSRTRRPERVDGRIFGFTRQLPPELAGGWVGPEFLKKYRGQAWDAFENIAMPTTQDEAWRRTDLRSLQAGSFQSGRSRWPNIEAFTQAPQVFAQTAGRGITWRADRHDRSSYQRHPGPGVSQAGCDLHGSC